MAGGRIATLVHPSRGEDNCVPNQRRVAMRLASPPALAPLTARALTWAVLAMGAVVLLSNILVQYPVNDWLTWGAFSYPLALLLSNLINRRFGPRAARMVAWCGFALAVLLSFWLATPRIAAASCSAFIAAQLLDISVFDRLRNGHWWRAPIVATTYSASLDTTIFLEHRLRRHGLAVDQLGCRRSGGEAGHGRVSARSVPRVAVA